MKPFESNRENIRRGGAGDRANRSPLRHVCVATIPFAKPPGSALPILVLPDGTLCHELYQFFRAPAHRGRSASWRKLHIDAVALFYDHYHALLAGPTPASRDAAASAEVLADFAERLLYGTVHPNGRDPTGLFWSGHTSRRSYDLLLAVRSFCRFLCEGQGSPAPTPPTCERVLTAREWFARQKRSENSVLAHLGEFSNGQQKRDAPALPLPFTRQIAGGRGGGRPTPFPVPLELPFFRDGLLPTGEVSQTQRGIAIRNTLLFLLLLFGGLRKSEPLHLLLQDVEHDPVGQGTTVWFTDEAVAAWKAEPRTTAGGQPWYSPVAILTALTLRAVFHLALRQTEGLIGSIIHLLGLALAVPDHSTLSRRAATLEVPRPQARRDGEPLHLLVDSTGLKLCGAGEWLIEKHGAKTRRSWRKLHIGMNADTGQIIAAKLTTKDVDDGVQVGPLLDQMAASVASFTADGAYDQDGVSAAVVERHPEAAVIVPPRSTAVPSETAETAPTQRDHHLQFIAKHGRAAWQKASGYTTRARVEATIGRFKQVIGDGLRSRTDERPATEVGVAVHALNRMLELGRPISVRIA